MKFFLFLAVCFLICVSSFSVFSQESVSPCYENVENECIEQKEKGQVMPVEEEKGLHPLRVTAGMGVLGVLLVWLFMRKEGGFLSKSDKKISDE